MSQEELQESPDGPHVGQTSRKGFTKTAWAAVAILVLASILWQSYRVKKAGRPSVNGAQQDLLDVQGQYLVAAAQVPGVRSDQLYEGVKKSLNTGSVSARLRFVVLAGELIGPGEALEQVDAVEKLTSAQPGRVSQQDERLLAAVRRLYSDYQEGRWDAPSLESGDRQLLENHLGWFGTLALAPDRTVADQAESATADPAREEVMATAWRTFSLVILACFIVLGMGLAGLAGAITFLVFIVTRKVRSAIATGTANSGIYAETFAVWMFLFATISVAGAFIVRNHPDSQLLANSVTSVLTLIALIWPVMRGTAWKQVRRDIGWYADNRPIREIAWGMVCYVSNFPIVAIGILATLALQQLYNAVAGSPVGLEPTEVPTHPVVEWVGDAGWFERVHILILAAVIAPIVEETVFRGVLYRHLREGTAKWRTGASIVFSVAFNGFIFAVIHPQGLLAIPALMSVAAGLSLAREWRGSLLAPITMHALNNGVLMLLMFSLL